MVVCFLVWNPPKDLSVVQTWQWWMRIVRIIPSSGMALTSIQLMDIVQFEKISITSPRKVNENSKWEGGSKAKFCKGRYGVRLEFSEGLGVQNKNLPWEGGVWIFSRTTHEFKLEFSERWRVWLRGFTYFAEGKGNLQNTVRKKRELLYRAGIRVQEIFENLTNFPPPEGQESFTCCTLHFTLDFCLTSIVPSGLLK